MRAAYDSSLCGGRQGDFASAEATKGLSDRPLETFGHPLINSIEPKRRQVAAALSAAVTTTKLPENAPNSQAEPTS